MTRKRQALWKWCFYMYYFLGKKSIKVLLRKICIFYNFSFRAAFCTVLSFSPCPIKHLLCLTSTTRWHYHSVQTTTPPAFIIRHRLSASTILTGKTRLFRWNDGCRVLGCFITCRLNQVPWVHLVSLQHRYFHHIYVNIETFNTQQHNTLETCSTSI